MTWTIYHGRSVRPAHPIASNHALFGGVSSESKRTCAQQHTHRHFDCRSQCIADESYFMYLYLIGRYQINVVHSCTVAEMGNAYFFHVFTASQRHHGGSVRIDTAHWVAHSITIFAPPPKQRDSVYRAAFVKEEEIQIIHPPSSTIHMLIYL